MGARDGEDHGWAAATAKLLIGGPTRLEGVASGYWTRLAKQSSGLISHCSSTLPPSVVLLGAKVTLTARIERNKLNELGRPRSVN